MSSQFLYLFLFFLRVEREADKTARRPHHTAYKKHSLTDFHPETPKTQPLDGTPITDFLWAGQAHPADNVLRGQCICLGGRRQLSPLRLAAEGSPELCSVGGGVLRNVYLTPGAEATTVDPHGDYCGWGRRRQDGLTSRVEFLRRTFFCTHTCSYFWMLWSAFHAGRVVTHTPSLKTCSLSKSNNQWIWKTLSLLWGSLKDVEKQQIIRPTWRKKSHVLGGVWLTRCKLVCFRIQACCSKIKGESVSYYINIGRLTRIICMQGNTVM